MASTRVTKVYTNTGDRRTYTVSAWVKRSKLGATQDVISAYRSTDGLQTDVMRFPSDDTFQFYMHSTNSAGNCELKTIRKFRDTNAWYHFVTRVDTTQGTAADRVRIYVNGVQETAFVTENYMNQNGEGVWGIGASHTTHTIGAVGTANYFDGYVSHVHYADGQSLAPTVFGETDSTTGEWKIKTSPSFTLGTNGFTILKDGNTVTDQSTNSNDFSVAGGTLTKSEDNPSNIFCNLNPLGLNNDVTFACGNNNATYGTSGTRSIVMGTLGANSGKYYWEVEIQGNSDANNAVLGVSMSDWETGYAVAGETNQSWGLRGYDGAVHNNNSSVGGTWATFTNGDIIGVAINLDDEQSGLNKLYFSKNGTWLNGANPTNHSATTGVVGITKPENGVSGFYFPVVSDAGSSATPKFKCNFGNGYFGTVAVSSAGTNASGNGIFEYDVPTGFTALSTKGLNL